MDAMSGIVSAMAGSSLPAEVTVGLLSNVLDQSAALSAQLLADMPPPAGLSDLGGLLDTLA